jgi:raffinose/stachyose/melibiose transport system permease protein
VRNIAKPIGTYLIATVFLLIAGYPFVFIFQSSFKSQMEYLSNIWSFPKSLFLGNYERIIQPDFLRYFGNSLLVTVITITLVIFIASLASYVFAKMEFKLSKYLFFMFVIGMMVPVHTTLIPVYVIINKLGLYNKLVGLIGPYISFCLPISIFIITGFFQAVPKELEEAARIDGCSHFVIYRKIMLPLSLPVLSTVAIYNFIYVWNEFIYALVLVDSAQSKTIPLGIREFYGMETINIPGVLTAIAAATIPLMVFYFLAQEKVISSLTSGAIKG